MRSIKDYIVNSLKGVAMGAADVVPGVSGGTIAFISGIYEELIDSIKSLNPKNLKKLFKEGFKSFWNSINGTFLLSLAIGIGISILSLAKLFHYLLEDPAAKEFGAPIFVWSFFFGLIIASVIYVAMQIKKWNYKIIISIIIGGVVAYFITSITPSSNGADPGYLYIFLCGMVAICAMILPGISGSFILLLMGQYEFILSVLSKMKFDYIGVFGVGAAIGLISFSNVLSWLLKKFHDITVAFLAGFMIGSLNKIWPWKHTLESYVNSNAEIIPINQENVLPNAFYELTGKDPKTFYAILMAITGFLIIFLLQSTFSKAKVQETKEV